MAIRRAAEVAAPREQRGESFPQPILDLGCGDGLVTSLVLPHVEIALDPDRQALAKAARLGVYERFEACLIEDAPVENGSLGTVFSNSVLEHIEHIDGALAVVARLLRPGGRLVFTIPSEAFGRWLVLPLRRYARRRNRQLLHLNLWPTTEWACRLARAGLQIGSMRGLTCAAGWSPTGTGWITWNGSGSPAGGQWACYGAAFRRPAWSGWPPGPRSSI